MEITKNVILDLLPAYLANEVVADTRAFVEEYLETDPELANVARQLATMEKPGYVPVPLTEDDKMKAYRKARRLIILTTVTLAGEISLYALYSSAGFLFLLIIAPAKWQTNPKLQLIVHNQFQLTSKNLMRI